jgi:hypothetical protein
MSGPMSDEQIVVRYTYRVGRSEGRVYAECLEADATGVGATAAEAVESLRSELRERLLAPDAVAPPSFPGRHRVDLVEADPPPTPRR